MLFRRRESESWWERLRVHLWPRRSWSRSGRYVVYRLRRLGATPHAIALGVYPKLSYDLEKDFQPIGVVPIGHLAFS